MLTRTEIINKLHIIIDNRNKDEDSERNHQIFAEALLYLVEST